MKALITALIVGFLTCPFWLSAQHPKRSINFYAGYGKGTPDTRYDFLYEQFPTGPVQTVINNIGETTFDDEYNVGLAYRHWVNRRVDISVQMGYTLLVQDFLLPASHKYFRREYYDFFWRDVSEYHIFQVSPQLGLSLLNAGQFRGGVNLLSVFNFSFKKQLKNRKTARNHLEYFATELYPGLFVSFGRIRLDAGARVLHLKQKDEAIANNGLNPDPYNPFKARFTISYSIWQR